MKKFLNYLQKTYDYSDYQIEVIEYFILCFVSDFIKFILIFAFFIYMGQLPECIIALLALLTLRLTGGGYHCSHSITCFLFSFVFLYTSVLLSDILVPALIIIIPTMLLCIFIAYKMVPIISTDRLEPSKELIKRSRFLNLLFLCIGTCIVTIFYTNQFAIIVFWVCVEHTIQLLLTKFQKGGKYYVT